MGRTFLNYVFLCVVIRLIGSSMVHITPLNLNRNIDKKNSKAWPSILVISRIGLCRWTDQSLDIFLA